MPTLAEVERLREAMRSLPEVKAENRNLTNQDAVKQLADDIKALRDKGYTWDEVAAFMSKNGIDIKPTTLKSYARRASSVKARKPRQRKAAPAATPPEPVQKTAPVAENPKPNKKTPSAPESDARFTPRKDSDDI